MESQPKGWDYECPFCLKGLFFEELPDHLTCPHCGKELKFEKNPEGEIVFSQETIMLSGEIEKKKNISKARRIKIRCAFLLFFALFSTCYAIFIFIAVLPSFLELLGFDIKFLRSIINQIRDLLNMEQIVFHYHKFKLAATSLFQLFLLGTALSSAIVLFMFSWFAALFCKSLREEPDEEYNKLDEYKVNGILSDQELEAFSTLFAKITKIKARKILRQISFLSEQYNEGNMKQSEYHRGLWQLIDKNE